MGYWEEKKEYEEELEEKRMRTSFCNICGRKLTNKNIKGKCVECEEIVCNNCGKVYKGKIVCSKCKEGIDEKRREQIRWSKVKTGDSILGNLVQGVRWKWQKSIKKASKRADRLFFLKK